MLLNTFLMQTINCVFGSTMKYKVGGADDKNLENMDLCAGKETSRKHTYTILTPLNPLLYSKTGVLQGIHYFSYLCSKT